MKRIAFVLIVVFLLFACAFNQKSYGQKLSVWIGQPEEQLLEEWGQPTAQKVVSNDTKILTYTKIKDWYEPIEYIYDMPGWGATDMMYDPFFDEYSLMPYSQIVDTQMQGICQTSFKVINKIVVSYKWRGDACF